MAMCSPDALASRTVKQLQELLRSRGLPVSGRKAVLIERLLSPPPRATVVKRQPSAAPPPLILDDVIAASPTPRTTADASCLRVASWNVAGLRALLKRDAGLESLRALVHDEDVDVLMLQETKLQEHHVAEVEPLLLDALASPNVQWRTAWSCSTARKGYAGVCTVWNDKAIGEACASAAECSPLAVDPEHEADREGRTLLLKLPLPRAADKEPPLLHVVNVYTPNSGAELKRLEYRTGANGWDERFRSAVLAPSLLPHVCVGGDLNVAVEDRDIFNAGERRLLKQAGTTAEERASLRRYLEPPWGMTDAFRVCHPHATGAFSYWSQRARNRPRNRGLRLDYFLLSAPLLTTSALVDVQILPALTGSDHAPVLMTLRTDRL